MPVIRPTRPKRQGPPGSGPLDAAIQALIDGELDGGEVTIYQGARPANSGTNPVSATLLGTFVLDTPSAPVFNVINSSNINLNLLGGFVYVTGTPQWARFANVDHSINFDADVALTGGPNVIVVNTTSWVYGQQMSVTSMIATTDVTLGLAMSGSITVT